MNWAQRIGIIAAFGLSSGCSGIYRVGSDAASSGGSSQGGAWPATASRAEGGALPGPGLGEGGASYPAISSGGGAALSAAGSGGSAASSETFAGGGSLATAGSGGGRDSAGSQGGEPSTPGATSFCGIPLPAAHDIQFAPPSVVSRRLSKFLFDHEPTPSATLPAETTRQWVGDSVSSTLVMLSTASARGMDRFVKNWWPGTPTPQLWAAYFSSGRGTLKSLLTSQGNGAGLLTDPSLLAHESISRRGRFVLEHLLCFAVPAPPADGIVSPPLAPGETRRSQLEATVAPQQCRSCHRLLDPFGYPLGNFALDGSYQTVENGLPIDTQATLPFSHSGNPTVLDARDFGEALANSCEAALCLARSMLHDATVNADLPSEASEQEVARIAADFTASGLRLPELVRLVAESDVFLSAE